MVTSINTLGHPATPQQPTRQKAIPVRHIQFKFPDNFPKYFAFSNPTATALFVVLSNIFPDGERFFVESLRNFRDDIRDPQLKQEIRGFIGQEAMHAREHERFNQALKQLGFDIETPQRYIKHALNILRKLPKDQQLACTVLMEHFTAHLATQWLSHEPLAKLSDPHTMVIWQWHALEELEHKAVSFEVYQQACNDSRLKRYVAFASTLMVLTPAVLGALFVVAYKDQCHKNMPSVREGVGLIIDFIVPAIRQMPDFLSKNFNPLNDDTQALETEWHEKLLGKNGLLNGIYMNKPA